MKILSLTGFAVGFFLLSICPGACEKPREITVEQAAHHLGEEIIVRGTVTQIARSHGEVFICFGGQYPNQAFKGFIAAGSTIGRDKTLDTLAGIKIGIYGKITGYQGRPEIVIRSLNQILGPET